MKPLYVKKNGVVYKISGTGIPSIYPAANVEYDNTVTSELQATDVQDAIDELSTRQGGVQSDWNENDSAELDYIKNKPQNLVQDANYVHTDNNYDATAKNKVDSLGKNTAYGTCSTAGDVKDKVATLSNATNWVLEVGTIVGIRFTYTNTYAMTSGNRVTLNVNSTGAKEIRYSDDIWTGGADVKCPTAFGEANQTIYYMYDGTYWVWISHSKDNDTLYNFVGREFRSCDWNDAGLETGFGGDANLMVVNGVYYYNSNGPSTSIGASANDGSVFVHTCDDGYVVQIAQNYETGNIFVRAMNDNVWGAWKKPDAGTVNGLTVQTAVPSGAVFTDTNTTYTFAGGTNKFTVTPAGGTAQDVTVTPSITNNVTGTGTSGYLTKFNGANTITNGPQLGSDTTKYLRNDGSWQVPPDNDTKNTAGSTNSTSKLFLVGATEQSANPQTYSNTNVFATNGALQSYSMNATTYGVNQTNGTEGGISLYAGVGYVTTYGIAFRGTGNSGKHGYVQSDWATYFYMNSGGTTRGWVFNCGATSGVASISGAGNAVFNGSVTIGGNQANTSGARMEYNSTNKCIDFVFA